MKFTIQQVPEHKVAGFHMVGPWEQTVHQGFAQLALWVKSHNITGNPCFEHYLNEGSESGVRDIDMYIPVTGKR